MIIGSPATDLLKRGLLQIFRKRSFLSHGQSSSRKQKRRGQNRALYNLFDTAFLCQTRTPIPQLRKVYSADSVATSFQFGSRDVVSRAKVQMSTTSLTLAGSPSTTSPDLSRVAEMSWL